VDLKGTLEQLLREPRRIEILGRSKDNPFSPTDRLLSTSGINQQVNLLGQKSGNSTDHVSADEFYKHIPPRCSKYQEGGIKNEIAIKSTIAVLTADSNKKPKTPVTIQPATWPKLGPSVALRRSPKADNSEGLSEANLPRHRLYPSDPTTRSFLEGFC
jgi:hypothetical protein